LFTFALFLFTLITAPPARAIVPAGAPLEIGRDSVRVVFWPGDERLAEQTLTAALTPLKLPGLPAEAGVAVGTIVLAPTPALWDSLTGGVPAWAAGIAIPGTRTIVLPMYPAAHAWGDDAGITLRHELAHLALHRWIEGRVPRWFDEGYATWVSGGFDASAAWQLRLAFLLGRAPPLDSLTLDWPAQAGEARLAYFLSASAVSYLAERGGERGFPMLMQEWKRVGALDPALRRVYGMTLGQFEAEWVKVVERRYGWLLALSHFTAFWLIFTLFVLVVGTLRRRHNRERLRQLEAEDRMLPPPGGTTELDGQPYPD
jgi:hypothetical protein